MKVRLSILFVSAVVAACSTAPAVDPNAAQRQRDAEAAAAANAAALREANDRNRVLEARQKKLECMTRYNTVTQACATLYSGEASGPELMAKLDHCARVRGYAHDTCQ